MKIEINDEVWVLAEQGAVHLRALSGRAGPAELTVDEADRLVEALERIIHQIRAQEST